jgi:hypothetical protein
MRIRIRLVSGGLRTGVNPHENDDVDISANTESLQKAYVCHTAVGYSPELRMNRIFSDNEGAVSAAHHLV